MLTIKDWKQTGIFQRTTEIIVPISEDFKLISDLSISDFALPSWVLNSKNRWKNEKPRKMWMKRNLLILRLTKGVSVKTLLNSHINWPLESESSPGEFLIHHFDSKYLDDIYGSDQEETSNLPQTLRRSKRIREQKLH